ncbi:hypothetical protein ACFVS2_20170 [Brevibacillus sp. NPDC058079]|uniref:hypothetical protein n=1 Tax=Brevibacillus sp. NPDC058079 TaxID=3346330 RepID=UPI0036EC1738
MLPEQKQMGELFRKKLQLAFPNHEVNLLREVVIRGVIQFFWIVEIGGDRYRYWMSTSSDGIYENVNGLPNGRRKDIESIIVAE